MSWHAYSVLALLQVHMLHVDAAVGPVSVMFSGAKEPIAAAGQTAVFGKLAVARQITAPPETYKRRVNVGRCRDIEIEVHSLCNMEFPVLKLHGQTVRTSNCTSMCLVIHLYFALLLLRYWLLDAAACLLMYIVKHRRDLFHIWSRSSSL